MIRFLANSLALVVEFAFLIFLLSGAYIGWSYAHTFRQESLLFIILGAVLAGVIGILVLGVIATLLDIRSLLSSINSQLIQTAQVTFARVETAVHPQDSGLAGEGSAPNAPTARSAESHQDQLSKVVSPLSDAPLRFQFEHKGCIIMHNNIKYSVLGSTFSSAEDARAYIDSLPD